MHLAQVATSQCFCIGREIEADQDHQIFFARESAIVVVVNSNNSNIIMESTNSKSSALTLTVSSQAETQPLLSPVDAPSIKKTLSQTCISPTHLCLPSKAAVLILFWSAIVGTMYTLAMDATVAVGVALQDVNFHGQKLDNILLNVLIPYLCTALVMLLYPLGGFMADIWCGRYKSVMISLCVLACSFGCFTIGCTFAIFGTASDIHHHSAVYTAGKSIFIIIFVAAFLLFFVGLSGFQANFIQLGLDQLHEAPSEYLGLFVHWAMWTSCICAPIFHVSFAAYGCTQSEPLLYGLFSLPMVCFLVILFVVVFSYRKRHWFYIEPGQHNPYKMVLKVLMFAKKHKYPCRRSAFSFNDVERPTRVDFAKERFGGPFKTEEVEDVKAFLRILAVLLALGPIYILEVPTSYFIFPSFTLHTGIGPKFEEDHCTARWLILESGTLAYAITVVVFPVYIWMIYSILRRCVPRIFSRILLGGVLLFLTVLFMLVIDVIGHLNFSRNDLGVDGYHSNNSSGTYCMFKINITTSSNDTSAALDLPWGVHVIPNFLISLSPMLVTTSAFEFISAQSPHSMKGLLVGLLFAIKGLFQLSSAFLLLPFSLPHYWETIGPNSLNCGFGYFVIIIVLAFIGMVIFLGVVKRYQYRERDDPPFDQMAVEEVFARTVNQNTYQVYSPENNMEFANSILLDS